MTMLSLTCHPDTPARAVTAITVQITRAQLVFAVEGGAALVLPPPVPSARADELWRTTCFELFVKPPGGSGYAEHNFSPSTRWAAYRFDAYRAGMRALSLAEPPVIARLGDATTWTVRLPAEALGPVPVRVGLSAVIEETGGHKSYWALAHPPGAPDFHDDACFAHLFAAPKAP